MPSHEITRDANGVLDGGCDDLRQDLETVFAPDAATQRIVDVYHDAASVYQRTMTALGRVQRFQIMAGSTIEARIPNEQVASTKILNRR